jgi:SDR family mycofactocin-dependent oxidoreductase
MADLTDRVALVTGAARGLGKAQALALAEAGADLALCDGPAEIPNIPYPLGGKEELEATAREVEQLGRRCVTAVADVRSGHELSELVDRTVDQLGHLDIVVANAGVVSYGPAWELLDEQWDDVIAVNLTGAWQTCKAALPAMLDHRAHAGGAVILVASVAALRGIRGVAHYVAAKHGLVGLMRTLAIELAPHGIRANAVCPTVVETPMMSNSYLGALVDAADDPTVLRNALPVERIEPADVAYAVRWLVSDEARYVTGVALPVDAGLLLGC